MFAAPARPVTRVEPGPEGPWLRGVAAIRRAGAVPAALQLARPVVGVPLALVATQRLIGRGLLLALAAAVLLAWFGPLLVSREVHDLTTTARRMAEGDLRVRLRLDDANPYAPVSRALDHLAESLSRTVNELRAERDLLGRILEAMDEGVLVLDDDRRILVLNQALSRMLFVNPQTVTLPGTALDSGRRTGPRSPLDVAGKSLVAITLSADLNLLLDKLSTAGARATGEIKVGELKPRRLMVRATRLSPGPAAFLLVFDDVTEMRRLESLRRDFVANVSHELRTPVAAVRSAAETAARRRARATRARPSASSASSTATPSGCAPGRGSARPVADRVAPVPPQCEPLAVARVMADVLALFRDRAESRRIRLASTCRRRAHARRRTDARSSRCWSTCSTTP